MDRQPLSVQHMIPHSYCGLIVKTVAVVGALLSGIACADELAPPPKAIAAVSTQPGHAPPRKPLDLRAPNITHLFTSEQLNKILSVTFLREDIEEVEVQGERDRTPSSTPDVWPGIAAPVWAILNPTQSWRILAPLPPDQTRGLQYVRANATDAYILEPAGLPSPHAH